MSFVSYAQFYEDVFLWRCFSDQKNGFYIDIGAAWPDQDSITKAFYDRGWSGINIEPNNELYRDLCVQRKRDRNINIAVGEQVATINMYFFQNAGLSTADVDIALRHIAQGENYQMRQVEVTTLEKVCKQNLDDNQIIDFLKIDVEGLEKSVIQGANFKLYRPKVVVVESVVPMSQQQSWDDWEPMLLTADYVFCYFDGLNRFYVANEHLYLQNHFSLPVNLWDDVVRFESTRLQSEIPSKQYQLDRQQSKIVQLEQQINAIYRSRSWRMTAPLRYLRTKTKLTIIYGKMRYLVTKLKIVYGKITSE